MTDIPVPNFTAEHMDAFRARLRSYLQVQGGSEVTLSKKLFANPETVTKLLNKTGGTSYDRLVEAEKRFMPLEAEVMSREAAQ